MILPSGHFVCLCHGCVFTFDEEDADKYCIKQRLHYDEHGGRKRIYVEGTGKFWAYFRTLAEAHQLSQELWCATRTPMPAIVYPILAATLFPRWYLCEVAERANLATEAHVRRAYRTLRMTRSDPPTTEDLLTRGASI